MQPIPAMLTLEHSVMAACEIMDALDMSFLVIGAPATGRLLGIVVRDALDLSCREEGHDPDDCRLVNHLETDIDFCLESEPIDEVFGDSPASIRSSDAGASGDQSIVAGLPVVVVDEYKLPVGLLSRPGKTE